MTRETNGSNHETSPRKIANHDRLIAMGEAVNRRSATGARPKPRNRRRVWIRRSIIAFGLVVVLIIGGVAADYFYLGSLVNKVNVNGLQSSAGAAENILLIGSTSRCALKVQNKAYGLCSQGVNGVNSDITMVLHLVPSTGSVSLLSIPRDLFVPNARVIGSNKIDAALYEGPSQLIAAIEEDFAIPINHYVVLNFDTFANVVNALGGVKMYFSVPIFDAYSGLNIERKGCYSLDGYHALQVVRARHLQIQPNPSNHVPRSWPFESLSDLARIRRTHEFLRVLAAKVASRGLGNPLTDQNLATSVLPDLTVDSGFSEGQMVSLARTFAHTSISNVPQFTFPVTNVETGSLLFHGYYYGSVVFPVQPNGLNAVNQIFSVAAGHNSFTGASLPSPSTLKISVENGSGLTTGTASIVNPLRAKGFDIVSSGNAASPGPVSESVVWYGGPPPPAHGNWSSPALAAAQTVLAQLQGPAIIGYNPKSVTAGAIVTVQIGTGLSVRPTVASKTKTTNAPSKTSSTSTSKVPTTTTPYVPPGLKGNKDFTTPSAVSQALMPWDPRGCNAAGTGPAS